MNTALLIDTITPAPGVEQRYYRLDPPLEYDPSWDGTKCLTQFIVVSASSLMPSGPETYIFPADKDGQITNWLELDGSFRGELNHNRALANIGYWPGETP